MSNKMLIDATHPEETRVVVVRNGRVEEFDFESAARKLLRGNIYLAKVTRVEPSLQAAFVDYGGNRHGFLAFNEIHPDYYQIPVADRQALIDEEAAAEAEAEAAVDRRAEALARRMERMGSGGREPALPEAAASVESSDDEDHAHIEEVEHEEDVEEIGGELQPIDTDADSEAESSDERDHDTDGGKAKAPRTIAISTSGDARLSEDTPVEAVELTEAHADEDDDETSSASDDELSAAADDAEDNEDDETHDESDDHEPAVGAEARAPTAPAVQETIEESGSPDAFEDAPPRSRRRPRQYKIQEVIKRRQIILVQVVKEERGNKGAALTTYLSLAGRYTVLMPNTARGGGISRKITNPQDRRRLKSIAQELEVPEGMGLIIRTAGAARTKQEIKRDFEYLLRLWESVRDLTLQSTAPSLVYEEGDLIKRSIRDLYNKEIEEIVVAGTEAHKEAHDFMHMLMPSHAKNVLPYQEPVPLFTRYRIENQLNAMFSPQVTLRSGGYIVINQTEALVAIDVNSGKSTREFSIEETALATNLEAADEIARQLKLRDLAGLIVIDFIDMEEKRNNRAVERRLKDALRFDRARIQLGRISHFGLMEMSRQRLRTGVLEGSTTSCPHCQGTGIIRSTESIALAVLRGIEDSINAGANTALSVTATTTVALYLLNNKRAYISEIEERHGFAIVINGSDRVQGANFTIERGAQIAVPSMRRQPRPAVNMDWGFEDDGEAEAAPEAFTSNIIDVEVDNAPNDEFEHRSNGANGHGEDGGRNRRRRRRRGGRRGDRSEERSFSAPAVDIEDDETAGIAEPSEPVFVDQDSESEAESFADDGQSSINGDERKGRRSRRRGRRGGRRGRGERSDRRPFGEAGVGELHEIGAGGEPGADVGEINVPGMGPQPSMDVPAFEALQPDEPAPPRSRPARLWERNEQKSDDVVTPAAKGETPTPKEEAEVKTEEPEPKAPVKAKVEKASAATATAVPPSKPERPVRSLEASEPRLERIVVGRETDDETTAQAAPQRKGWWQRRLTGE